MNTEYTNSNTIDNDSVISTLNNLIETCKDGQNGFQTAADSVQNSELKSVFYEYAQQRAQFSGELQNIVRNLGGDPENSGSTTAALHRGWINIKSAVTGQDDASILNECERGEDVAKNAYEEALQESLPANVSQTVQQQYAQVKEAHDRIKALRNSFNASGSNTASTGY